MMGELSGLPPADRNLTTCTFPLAGIKDPRCYDQKREGLSGLSSRTFP